MRSRRQQLTARTAGCQRRIPVRVSESHQLRNKSAREDAEIASDNILCVLARLGESTIGHFAVRATWRSSLVSRPSFCTFCAFS